MRRVIIIQARMASTRLPGKVLMDICGRPMLAQQVRRLQRCALVDDIVVATSTNAADDPIEALSQQEGLGCFRGSEQDVLGRFVGAARHFGAEVIVRVTADCPLIDPQITDLVIRELMDHAAECDYASNVLRRTYPRGLDAEAFFLDVLLRIDRLARSPAAREHVSLFMYTEQPDLFSRRSVEADEDHSAVRWTVDTEPDMVLVRALYSALELSTRPLPYSDILAYFQAHPELRQLNEGVETWTPSRQAH